MKRILEKPLVLVTGKGGVGKSTVSAALASAVADRGGRALLVEVGSRPAMAVNLGLTGAPPGPSPSPIRRGLDGAVLDHDSAVRVFLHSYLPGGRLVKAVLANQMVRTFLRAAPSVTEVTLLSRIEQFVADGRWDTVVVDMPAFGHAYQMLRAPRSIGSMVRGGIISGRTEELDAMVRDPSRCAVVAVTLPEDMPVSETVEIGQRIALDVGAGLQAVVVNQVLTPLLPADDDQAQRAFDALRDALSTCDKSLSALVALGNLRTKAAERSVRLVAQLADELAVPIAEVPLIPAVADGSEIGARMASMLVPPPGPAATAG